MDGNAAPSVNPNFPCSYSSEATCSYTSAFRYSSSLLSLPRTKRYRILLWVAFQKYLMSNFYLVAVCNISNLYKKILQLFSISFFCFGIYWHSFLIVWYFIPWTIKNKSASILKCKLTHWFSALKIITYKELQYSGV